MEGWTTAPRDGLCPGLADDGHRQYLRRLRWLGEAANGLGHRDSSGTDSYWLSVGLCFLDSLGDNQGHDAIIVEAGILSPGHFNANLQFFRQHCRVLREAPTRPQPLNFHVAPPPARPAPVPAIAP